MFFVKFKQIFIKIIHHASHDGGDRIDNGKDRYEKYERLYICFLTVLRLGKCSDDGEIGWGDPSDNYSKFQFDM